MLTQCKNIRSRLARAGFRYPTRPHPPIGCEIVRKVDCFAGGRVEAASPKQVRIAATPTAPKEPRPASSVKDILIHPTTIGWLQARPKIVCCRRRYVWYDHFPSQRRELLPHWWEVS